MPTLDDTTAPVPTRRARGRAAGAGEGATEVVRKAVNTLAIVPRSTRITTLGRKAYNVLLYHAQEQGLDRELYRVPLDQVIKGVDFDSNDQALIKKHLRAMVSTTVEWQSPTTGEGTHWHVSGLLAHAALSKVRGQTWIEWSYAVNLKQELIQPSVFARLRLEVISQLRSHAGVALYEICTRYKDVGRTARQHWRWWQPVLSGNPPSERLARQEYRIFKRDTLKPAVAEVTAITDLEVELVEYKLGRHIDEIQFRIQAKKPAPVPTARAAEPVDLGLVAKARRLGVAEDTLDALLQDHGEAAVRDALASLERRAGSSYPEPLRDPTRYLRALMPAPVPASRSTTEAPTPAPVDDAEAMAKRRAFWLAEWMRRRRQAIADDIRAMSAERQADLEGELLADLQRRQVHPSLARRLQQSGWQHPMVVNEMVRFYAVAALGEHWDQPDAEALLAIAAEMGSAGPAAV